MRLSRRALLVAPALLPATAVRAQQYPDKQIRMIIPFAAGGTTDLLARAIGQQLNEAWGQPVISDNRAGANGVIATEIVAKSPGDGYTLELVAMGHATNPLVYKRLPFDADKDFTSISLIATFPQLVMVHPKVPAKTLQELLALAKKANPPLTYASGGNGSSQHFAGALFTHMAGVTMTHVAYKGGNPALQDLMAGNVDMMIIQPNSPSQVSSGQVRALAVSSRTRSSFYPDLPTVAEAGVPGYQSVAWYGLIGPKGMPPAVLAKISDAVRTACKAEPVKAVVANQGGEMVASTPQGFDEFIQAERKRYAPIVQAAGMMVE
ncbi:MAG: tripartite tricarboxylate transporter substrate binding protein [Proteobacteria bacterium]|nr:tripartite tricarboxylate transporter substrate binding protein [Pseudomonadota bacterium]